MDYTIISNIGNREQNEDYVNGIIEDATNSGFFVVADGLGGHGRGEVASQSVVESCLSCYRDSSDKEGFIEKTISCAQRVLLEKQIAENAQDEMKTTIVALLVLEDKVCWGHVGDSRLYYFKNRKLVSRTIDHSVPQMLALSGEIRDKDIRKHPDRNKVLRVMGTEWEDNQAELSEDIIREGGEAFLLCTDGFWENITEKEMIRCLKRSKTSGEWLEKMNCIVQKRGKKTDMDNNTALVVFA